VALLVVDLCWIIYFLSLSYLLSFVWCIQAGFLLEPVFLRSSQSRWQSLLLGLKVFPGIAKVETNNEQNSTVSAT
jgi:hypothetical protein